MNKIKYNTIWLDQAHHIIPWFHDIIDYSVELCNSRPSHESEFNAHSIQIMNVYECNGKNIFIR